MQLPQSKTAAVLASLTLLVAGISVWRTLRSSTTINLSPLIGIGEVLAEETAKATHDRGRVVVVISPEHQQSDSPLHAQWEAFRRELQKHGGLTLVATEIVAPDPNDPQPDMAGCPIGTFKRILEQHGQADAIVFFLGTPSWKWLQDMNSLPPPGTSKLVVLSTTFMGAKLHYEPYFKNEIMAALIIRGGAGTGQIANPKTPREWFDNEYRVFTPQNYDSLPE